MVSNCITLNQDTYESLQQELIELRQVVADLEDANLSTSCKNYQQQMGLFIEYMPAAIAVLDEEMRYLLVSRRWEEDYGLGNQEIIGRSHYEIFPEIPQYWRAIHQRCLAGVIEKCEEDAFTRADGTINWVKWEIHPWYKESGEIGGIIMFTEVITARKQAEAALKNLHEELEASTRDIRLRKQVEAQLQEQEQFLRSIYDGVDQLIFVVNVLGNGVFRYAGWNSPTEKATGISNTQVTGKIPEEVFGTIEGAAINQRYQTCLDTGVAITYEECLTFYGQETWWMTTINPIRNSAGQIYRLIGTTFNITERKQAEIKLQQQAQNLENTLRELQRTQSQLIQSEKMSSLGNMVAGVAHEINNPVNFIHGNLIPANEYVQCLLQLLELYQEYYPEPPEEIQAQIVAIDLDFLKNDLIKLLQSMGSGTQRIREIVLSLRNFSRLDEAEFKKVDIHEGINSTLMILQNRLKAKPGHPEITVIKEYAQLPLIECYPGQMNQVFMNLLSNAIDVLDESFVGDKGEIRIRTELVEAQRLVIRISDNGRGIRPEILSKLFDPFFTTKDVGKGTGLGLSISYQIVVDKHRGKLYCNSTSGQGAEFVIDIPITQLE